MRLEKRQIIGIVGPFLILILVGCESTPMRTLRGARYYSAGSEALERGDSSAAIRALTQAADLVPRASEIQNHLGLAYWASGDAERADLAFGRALELDCDNAEARRNRQSLEALMSVESDSAHQGRDDEQGVPHGG